MAHNWGVHTIAARRMLSNWGFTRSGTRAQAIRRNWRFRPVRLGGVKQPGGLGVRAVGRRL